MEVVKLFSALSKSIPVDNFGTVVGESPDCLLLSGTVVSENPDHVCWDTELTQHAFGSYIVKAYLTD